MKGMTDVCVGKMTLKQIHNEIVRNMTYRRPKRLIVDIKRQEDGYQTTIWISEEDF